MLKNIIRRVLYGNKATSDSYIKYLRKLGCKIGDGTVLFNHRDILIDKTRPWLIEIGKNVQITRGVVILTHGYDWSVLKGMYGDVLGSSGKVKIGDNCFIGMNTTILKGVTIGNNVIIGANSLVNKSFPDNCVIAGNPAKIIMTLDEYYNKRKDCQVKEAKELVKEYINTYNIIPDKKILREYFWLFENRNSKITEKEFVDIMKLGNNYDSSLKKYKETESIFETYEDFINFCVKDGDINGD